MFDRYREAKIETVSGSDRGPSGHAFKIVQGKHTLPKVFESNQYQLATEERDRINKDVLARNPRRIATLSALAGTALVTTLVAGGFAIANRGENGSSNNTDVGAPAPTETRFITSPTTEFVTATPKPEVKIKRVEVTVTAKPHAHHHEQAANHNTTTHQTSIPEAPTSTYVPPAQTYTPPPPVAAKPPEHHQPHFTVHHLHE